MKQHDSNTLIFFFLLYLKHIVQYRKLLCKNKKKTMNIKSYNALLLLLFLNEHYHASKTDVNKTVVKAKLAVWQLFHLRPLLCLKQLVVTQTIRQCFLFSSSSLNQLK